MALHQSAETLEAEIDRAYQSHPLLKRPYSEAVLNLLAAAERTHIEHSGGSRHARSGVLTTLVNALKYGIAWIADYAPRHSSRSEVSVDALREADDLLRQARAYLSIVSAYTFARRNLIDLHAEGNVLVSSSVAETDETIHAYDMLVLTSVAPGSVITTEMKLKLASQAAKGLARGMTPDGVAMAHDVLAIAYEISSSIQEPYYLLPSDWQFERFQLADFLNVSNGLRALLFGWQTATILALAGDVDYFRRLIVPLTISKRQLVGSITAITHVSKQLVQHLLALLTYRGAGIRMPDPAVQPLIPAVHETYILSSPLLMAGAPERNLVKLINMIPTERSRYERLKNEKESLMRARLERQKPAYARSWYGRIPGRSQLPDIDYALVDDAAGIAVILELKWFIAPVSPGEAVDRSAELQKGVIQCKKLNAAAIADPSLFVTVFPASTDLVFAVISANSIGLASIQDCDVPIVNENHLIHKLESSTTLRDVAQWLRTRSYLPTLGTHFEQRVTTVQFFNWQLRSSQFRTKTHEKFLPG